MNSQAKQIQLSGKWFAPCLCAIFFILIMVQIGWHVMWRDELRVWQICHESTGLASLHQAAKYDGVPVLWFWIVFVLTRLSDNPFWMQLAHALIATAVIFVVVRCSPFSNAAKICFAFGYFPFFEYAVIARNYSLVFLFLMIACALISQPKIRWIWLTLAFFLLTQVSIWGAGLAGLMMLAAIAKSFAVQQDQKPNLLHIFVAGMIVLCGVVLCYLESIPGPGSSFASMVRHVPTTQRISESLATIDRAWCPIPSLSLHFWNTNIFDPHRNVQAILGVILAAAALYLLRNRPIALGLLLVAGAGLVGFSYYFLGFSRHHGHLFMLLIAAFWLAETTPSWDALSAGHNRWRSSFLMVILIVGLIAGIGTAGAALIEPFSASRQVAEYIQKNFDDRVVLVGVPDYCTSPISQWLDRPIYFPQIRRFARYNTQDDAERYPNDLYALLPQIADLIRRQHKNVVLICEADLYLTQDDAEFDMPAAAGQPPATLHVQVLPAFPNSVVEDEAAKLYLITLEEPSPPQTQT